MVRGERARFVAFPHSLLSLCQTTANEENNEGAGRVEQIQAYVRQFGRRVRPPEARLDEGERARLARIQADLHRLRSEVDALIVDYRARTGHR